MPARWTGGTGVGFSYPDCALRRFEIKDKLSPLNFPAGIRLGAPESGIVNEGEPPMRFGQKAWSFATVSVPEDTH